MITVFYFLHLAIGILGYQHVVKVAPTIQVQGMESQDISQYQTLCHYINATNSLNATNTTVEFLPGIHEVDNCTSSQLVVEHVSNIVWKGSQSLKKEWPMIMCNKRFNFIFRRVANLTLIGLTLSKCGKYAKRSLQVPLQKSFTCYWSAILSSFKFMASISLVSVTNLNLQNINISESVGYGLFARNVIGESLINSSTFGENKATALNQFAGGNAIFIFLDDSQMVTEQPHLTIQNSFFYNGTDNFQCEGKCEANKFGRQIRSNGLGIITIQNNYAVKVFVHNVTFFGNIAWRNRISILINDHSGIANSFQFINCKFVKDGALKIERNSKGNHTNINGHQLVNVENCTFSEGVDTRIYVFLEDENFFQDIIISNCTFKHFPSRSRSIAVLQVVQLGISSSCPRIRMKITNSNFLKNLIPCSNFELTTTPYSANKCPSIIIDNCTYEKNHSPYDYLISTVKSKSLYGQSDITFVETYEEKYRLNRGFLDQVAFQSTSFISNTLGPESFKGIVGATHVYISFTNCYFANSTGTAIQANHSVISLFETNHFINNTGKEGGALSLLESRLHLNNNSTTFFDHNKANYGGVIFATPLYSYITIVYSKTLPLCTLGLPSYEINTSTDFNILLNVTLYSGTDALYTGNTIFYGAFERCLYMSLVDDGTSTSLDQTNLQGLLFPSHYMYSIPSSLILCGKSPFGNRAVLLTYSGANFNLSIKTVGKSYGNILPVLIREKLCVVYFNDSRKCKLDYLSELRYGAGKQLITTDCNNITYSVHALPKKIFLEIEIHQLIEESSSINFKYATPVIVEVNLLPCPIGYEMSKEKPYSCVCTEYLSSFEIACNLNENGKVLRLHQMWIGFHYRHPSNISVHNSCPFDYCVPNQGYISLSQPDEQCGSQRTGILCGNCSGNLSIVLGTSNCKECTNLYLFLIIPFALAGIALVVLLLKCNLTVANGHINGIIFYANIIHINKPLFFSTSSNAASVIFSTFIAWLNLDLGIETCFFEKMDAYAKVWLQFVFPVYLWTIVGATILLAKFSSRVSRFIGNNSVPVLATLLIFSYAKLLRNIIAVVSFTYIEFEDGSSIAVWLQDGSVEYFSAKHAVLFLMAMLFTIGYIFPMTMFVFFAPCLQAWSNHKAFRWVNRLKPLLDAYQGPYTNKFRSWTGLMIFLRLLLFIVFAMNFNNDASMNFFWINILISPFTVLCFIKSVYRKKFANFLEAFSLLNLVMLCAVSWLVRSTVYNKLHEIIPEVTYVSIALTILAFLSILIYQVKLKVFPQILIRKKPNDNEPAEQEIIERVPAKPTITYVELRESLL